MEAYDQAFQAGQTVYYYHGRPVPPGFPYLRILLQGPPRERERVPARPGMGRGKRAKLFAPFDALDGFGESIGQKNTVYCSRVLTDESEKAELDRRLKILYSMIPNGKAARERHIRITVKYYSPCDDADSGAFDRAGRYISVRGTVLNVDPDIHRSLTVDRIRIPFDDILRIDAEDPLLFVGAFSGPPNE